MNQKVPCCQIAFLLPLFAIVKLQFLTVKTEDLWVFDVTSENSLRITIFLIILNRVFHNLRLAINYVGVEGLAFFTGGLSSAKQILIICLTNKLIIIIVLLAKVV